MRWRVAAIVAVVVGLGVGALLVVNGDSHKSSTTTSTTAASITTTTSIAGTTSTTIADTSTAVWPYASSTVRYRDPVAAARGFAVDFAGFTKPLVGEFRAGDASSGEG